MVIPMKMAVVVCMKNEREALLRALQKCGCMMLCTGTSSFSDAEASRAARTTHSLLQELDGFKKKKSLFAQTPDVELSEFEQIKIENDRLAERALNLVSDYEAAKEGLSAENERLQILLPWITLPLPVCEYTVRSYTTSTLGSVPDTRYDDFSVSAEKAGACVQKFANENGRVLFSLTYFNNTAEEIISLLTENDFESASLGGITNTPAQEIEKIYSAISELNKKIEDCRGELENISASRDKIALLYEQQKAQCERNDAPVGTTEQTVYLTGWVRTDRVEKMKCAIESVTQIYDLSLRDPEKGETPPTAVKNNRFVRQFECITDMFSLPRYGENDPNTIMAPWYWLLFGMMMGDAGYGLLMVLGVIGVKLLMKPKGNTAKLVNVFLYSTVTTMISGVLFGSYFGETWHPLLFSPMDDPVTMLIITLVIGVLHIFTGLVAKIVIDIKSGHWFDAICDEVSWILIISGGGMFFIPAVKTLGIALALVGSAIVLFTAGRKSKGIIGKVTGGLVGLYGVTGYVSDILSYSRILALSLATGVVGMVMNMLAGMVSGSLGGAGIIFSLLIYIIGHVFNLILGLLSAYVHACRLQYIEFFGKFYEGGGQPFKPFKIHTENIDLKK